MTTASIGTRPAARESAPEAKPGFVERNGPSLEDVGLAEVTSHGWRIIDERLPVGDPFRLLAFVERRAGSYEVMRVGRGLEWNSFPSFDDAVAYVVATSAAVAQERLRGRADRLRGIDEGRSRHVRDEPGGPNGAEPRPSAPDPSTVDPGTGTEPDGTPVDNPSGRTVPTVEGRPARV